MLFVLASLAFSRVAVAQYDLKTAAGATTEVALNATTTFLTSPAIVGSKATVTIVLTATKNTGTIAGTITLQGSLDGVSFVAMTDATAIPNITTKTATDVATQVHAWQVTGNRFKFYRVSWVGTGTMNATFSAKVLSFD